MDRPNTSAATVAVKRAGTFALAVALLRLSLAGIIAAATRVRSGFGGVAVILNISRWLRPFIEELTDE